MQETGDGTVDVEIDYVEAPPPPPARPVDVVVSSGVTDESAPEYTIPTASPVVTEESGSFQTETACVGGILVASCIELAQAAENCQTDGNKCDDEDGYAVAVGVISLFVCLCYLALLYFQPAAIVGYSQYISIFLVLWWGVGTVVLTFDAPFKYTGNGYFACWGATLLSIYYCQMTVGRFKMLGDRISQAIAGDTQKKLLTLIMFLSFVEAFAALVLWDDLDETETSDSKKQSAQETWAFSAGIISGGIAALYMLLGIFLPGKLDEMNFVKYFSWFLVAWWMFGAGVATFDAPFPATGNGYFCSWGAFLCSCYLFYLTNFASTSV